MTAESLYAPAPTAHTLRHAAIAAARHFRSESIAMFGVADENEVVVYRVDGRDPRGWDILGDSVVLTVDADGACTIENDR